MDRPTQAREIVELDFVTKDLLQTGVEGFAYAADTKSIVRMALRPPHERYIKGIQCVTREIQSSGSPDGVLSHLTDTIWLTKDQAEQYAIEANDESGIDRFDIALMIMHTSCSRREVVEALRRFQGDIVNTILHLEARQL
jgi:NACalpha-BTF3-like transcription factor